VAGNPVAAVVELLRPHVPGARVYGGRLPRAEHAHMPREAVVVRAAGSPGTFGGGDLPTVDNRVDVRCYGATELEAGDLAAALGVVLHTVREARTAHGRVLWIARSGGPTDVTEPDTTWPLTLTSWQVMGEWLAE